MAEPAEVAREEALQVAVGTQELLKLVLEGLELGVVFVADESGKGGVLVMGERFDEGDCFCVIDLDGEKIGFVSKEAVFFSAVEPVDALPDEAAEECGGLDWWIIGSLD